MGAVGCVAAMGSAWYCTGVYLTLIEADHYSVIHIDLSVDYYQSDHQREPRGGGGDKQDAR